MWSHGLCPVQAAVSLGSGALREDGLEMQVEISPIDFFYRLLMASYEIDHHRI